MHKQSLFAALLVVSISILSAFRPAFVPHRQKNGLIMRSSASPAEDSIVSGKKKKIATGLLTLLTSSMLAVMPPLSGLLAPAPAHAAKYGGFGAGSPEVLDPKTAEIVQEAVSSEEVKAGVEGLKALQSTIAALKDDLSKDSQLDVQSRLAKDLNVGKIRSTLNKYNAAFGEDTQRGTDRLIRTIIQDITELGEREASMKAGKPRAASKVAIIMKRLSAAEQDLSSLAQFLPK